jgi:hypothetical protein
VLSVRRTRPEGSFTVCSIIQSSDVLFEAILAYDGGGLAKGGTVTLYIDGNAVGSGRVEATMPMVLSADETSDVGIKRGSPITLDMPTENNGFTGIVQLIVIEAKPKEDVDYLISPEQLLHILMARQ